MPVYEYECKKCGKKFELYLVSIPDKSPRPDCPKCKSKKVDRLISRFRVVKHSGGGDDFGGADDFGGGDDLGGDDDAGGDDDLGGGDDE